MINGLVRKTIGVAAAAAVVFGGSAAAALTVAAGDHNGDYIIVLADGVDAAAATDGLALAHGLNPSHRYGHALKGFAATVPGQKLEDLKNDPRVAFVSEDRLVSALAKPGTAQPAESLPTGIDRVNAENRANKGTGVHVAVIDTGIQTNHPDLQANVAGGKNCSTGRSYSDGNGHGTHVAGTIAALDNDIGVVGVAPEAKLWAVRVLDNAGYGSWSSIICGLDFVTSKAPANGGPITVANMSLGGGGSSDDDCGNTDNDALHQAICRTRDAGVTIVVAAGNSGANASSSVPAAYDDAVITVSALADSDGQAGGLGASTSYGPDDTFASFSNYGSAVDLGAPGVGIRSTWKGSSYNTISGTSMASPHVAGAAALYLAANPGAAWTAVRDALQLLGEPAGTDHADPSGLHPENVLRADTL
jgi:subtilisin family serine protease